METPLFCVAEEAKEFTRKAHRYTYENSGHVFWLIESRNGYHQGDSPRPVLNENEDFESDFIGASVADCCKWAWEKKKENPAFQAQIIVIADERSAKDDTVSLQYYYGGPAIEYGRYGILPREGEGWYEFRVELKWVDQVYMDLKGGAPQITFPVYWGHMDEIIDEHGILDVGKVIEHRFEWCRKL